MFTLRGVSILVIHFCDQDLLLYLEKKLCNDSLHFYSTHQQHSYFRGFTTKKGRKAIEPIKPKSKEKVKVFFLKPGLSPEENLNGHRQVIVVRFLFFAGTFIVLGHGESLNRHLKEKMGDFNFQTKISFD